MEQAFNDMIKTTKKNYCNNKDYDGLKEWRKVKFTFSETCEGYYWNDSMLDTEQYDELTEIILNDFPEKNNDGNVNQYNHFIRKIVMIPYEEDISERKILQLAYNIGQYKGYLKKNKVHDMFTKGFLSFETFVVEE